MENLVMSPAFWRGKRVLITGHTGFKGSWLSLLLQSRGAEVAGFALEPPTSPSMFEAARVAEVMTSWIGDVTRLEPLLRTVERFRPEIVFHLAAQSLVRRSYADPVLTYATNVMGTVNLLEAVRREAHVRVVIVVTSDKCYDDPETKQPRRESDSLGGHDPYSSSKGCAELVAAAYRASYFRGGEGKAGTAVATARAGNVIGGGDWAENRLIPDLVRGVTRSQPARIRNPGAIRPWQHVLEPLSGYAQLAELLCKEGAEFAGPWNFGPADSDCRAVRWIVETLAEAWRGGLRWELDEAAHPHEAHSLTLDSSKALTRLAWRRRWDLGKALRSIVEWHEAHRAGEDMRRVTLKHIDDYLAA